jgi:hypothetical protein
MGKLPNTRKKTVDECVVVMFILVIVYFIASDIATRYVYSRMRPTQPQKAYWIYQTPQSEKIKVKIYKEKPVKPETVAKVIVAVCFVETVAKVIEAVCFVENQTGNPTLLGDGGDAVGVLQIHTEMVDECNRIMGKKVWGYADRNDPVKSRAMAWCFFNHRQNHYGLGDELDEQIRLGGLWNKPNGTAKADYLNKVRVALAML